MGKAVIFTGGKAPDKREYMHELESKDIEIVAVDSGYETLLQTGLQPHLFVGDRDSIHSSLPSSIAMHLFPREKDYTDTQLALEIVGDKGYQPEDIVLIGGGEGRLDHLLSLLGLYYGEYYPYRWYTAYECVYYVDNTLEVTGLTGNQTISVVGLHEQPAMVTSKGLKWELNKFPITIGHHSTSNENTDETVSLEVEKGPGVLLMICYGSVPASSK